jgi:hypothetical protein
MSDASLSGIYSTMRCNNSNPCSCRSSFDTANLNLAGPAWKGSVCRRGHMCYPHTYRYYECMLKTAHIILTLPLHSSNIRTYDCDICHKLIDQGTCGARCTNCGYDVCSACRIPDTAVYTPVARDCWLEQGLMICLACGYVWICVCRFRELSISFTPLVPVPTAETKLLTGLTICLGCGYVWGCVWGSGGYPSHSHQQFLYLLLERSC